MKKIVLIVGGAVLLMVAVAALALSGGKKSVTQTGKSGSGNGAQVQVAIESGGYNPGDITIKTGTKVTWTNKDSADHTVTSSANITSDPNYMGSYILKTGNTFDHTFTKSGTYYYRDANGNSFRGTVTVQD